VLDDAGQTHARVVTALRTDAQKGEEQVQVWWKARPFRRQARAIYRDQDLADGVIESGTAALLEPYLNRDGSRGELNFEPERLTRLVTRLDREGFQVHIHAIGDRAIRVSLDAHEAAQKATGAAMPVITSPISERDPGHILPAATCTVLATLADGIKPAGATAPSTGSVRSLIYGSRNHSG